MEETTRGFLTTYLIQKSLGLGSLEIMMDDNFLEEIVINGSGDPVWVYHKKHGWLKTNLNVEDEDRIRHYATMIGRKVGRQISVLEPLLDAHLNEGDRVNATLFPISTKGNTITFRRFSREPFTITHFLKQGTMSYEAASLIWIAMQYELSALIAGGTASGKTSALNVLATFFPPNQRIISIEDTREIRLPKFLHWVPMSTRQPNAESRGEVSMEDLLVNSLRMRPDRVLVGEVRRKKEAETLFEAIHTGHSVYATFHANSADETVQRLVNPPIDVPKSMLPAISLIIIQFRNRRTGKRRTFQIAEILPDASANVLMQYNPKTDKLVEVKKSKALIETLKLFTGYTDAEIKNDLEEKKNILEYLVKQNISTVDGVGRIMAEYYTNKDNLMRHVKENKLFG
jgi:flagellar protein FlaI